MLRKDLFRPPTLRVGDGDQEDRHATWLELFYDLAFAAAITQLAAHLSAHYRPQDLLRFVVLFVPVWWAWVGQTFYLTRFDSDDVGHRLLTLAQIIAVSALAVYIPGGLGSTSTAFALAYAAFRIVLILEYIRAGRHIPGVRPLTDRYAAGFITAASLWVVSVWIPVRWRFLLWTLAIIIDFLGPLTAKRQAVKFPPHFMHIPERVGQFTAIVIGETVVDTVTSVGKGELNILYGLTGVMGLIIAFTLAWGYFEGVRATDTRRLSSVDQVGKYQRWLYSHLPLTLAITAIAAGIRHVFALGPEKVLPPSAAWVLCGADGLSMLMLDIIFLSSTAIRRTPEMRRFILPHYVLAYLTLGVGFAGGRLSGLAIVSILAFLGATQIVYALRERPAGMNSEL